MEDAIRVKNLRLRYRTTARRQSIRSLRFFSGRGKAKTVRALKNVSFSVKKGEILGIIGTNGSGKSTLLKVLSGVLTPDSGTVDTFGQSVSLLSLGVGFDPALSGMDNIYLAGMLLGFTKEEICGKRREIVEFSELGSAIWRPVKTYSSGMYSKLAFSIAVMLRADILLVDEVLSVGDIRFRQKSHKKMEELIRDRNTTVIIVSHNLNEIRRLCDRVMWMDKGRVRAIGPTELLLKAYQYDLKSDNGQITSLAAPVVRVESDAERIRVFWEPVDGALDYRVYRKTLYPRTRWVAIQDGYRDTEYTEAPPSAEQVYFYTVRARAKTARGNLWSEFLPSQPVRLKPPTR